MSNTGLPVFDTTVQESNLWLKDVMEHMHTEDRHLAYLALRGTLHALRDRVGPESAVHLAAQLPMLLRGLYYEGWRMAASQTKERTRARFFDHVRSEFRQARPSIRTWRHAPFSRSCETGWIPARSTR